MTSPATRGQGRHGRRLDLSAFDAVLFDLDGVLTKTAAVHAAAWKRLFDEYLQARADKEGTPFVPFDLPLDYERYVDGKLRYDGVQSFLASRQIVLPYGTPEDGPGDETVQGLGNSKNEYFLAHVRKEGVEQYEDAVRFLRAVRARGLRTAVVSASKSAGLVVQTVGLTESFDVRVDGLESQRLGLAGKPAPDSFLEAARRLGVEPPRTIVVEDALAGVEAGRRGRFGLVIGVDRTGHGQDLLDHGADLVTADMTDLLA